MNYRSNTEDTRLKAQGLLAAIGPSSNVSKAFDNLNISSELITKRQLKNPHTCIWIAPSSLNLRLYSIVEHHEWLVATFGYFYAELHATGKAYEWNAVDTKTIAYKLNERGPDCLRDLDGAYIAIALSIPAGEVFVKADPGGIRKLYVFQGNGTQILSNKLHLLADICENDEDTVARNFYLVYGYHPLDHTVYQPVKRLTGSRVYRLDGQEQQGLPLRSHQAPSHPPGSGLESAVDMLYAALRSSMEAQLANYERVAVLLGGFDSSLVASLAKNMGLDVETFSFYYDDSSFNQTHTDTLADYLGITHNWIRIDQNVIGSGLRCYNKIFDQPTNWANYPIQTAHLAQEIGKRGFDAVLTGDGCDGAFYGYPGVYRSYRISARSLKLPKPLSRALTRIIAALRLEELGGHPVRVLLRLIRTLSYENPQRTYFMYRFMDETSIGKLTDSMYAPIEKDIAALMERISADIPAASGPALAYMGKNAAAPSKTKLAGCSDLSGLPIFSPYMHPAVISLTKTFPDEWLRPGSSNKREAEIGKYILVRMTQRYKLLPDSIIYQRKLSAVDGPVDAWYKNQLRDQIIEMLMNLPFSYSEPYIRRLLGHKLLEKFYTRHFSSDSLTTHALMLLVTYSTYFSDSKKGSCG